MVMDCASAELTKYAANAMLATRISFMNEIANVCELLGADVDHVRQAIASDKRIGPAFSFPGSATAGAAFPKDVQALIKFAGEQDYQFQILQAVEAVNTHQKKSLSTKIARTSAVAEGQDDRGVGLAFKPRTDDMREAPADADHRGISQRGAKVRAFDPEARNVAERIFKKRITTPQTVRRPEGRMRC